MIRAGEMRHQVAFQRRAVAPLDSAGEAPDTWETVITRRAAVERMPGAEVRAAAQRNERIPVLFRLRYVDGIDANLRLLFEGKVHNITSAVPDPLKTELVITAVELVGETA